VFIKEIDHKKAIPDIEVSVVLARSSNKKVEN